MTLNEWIVNGKVGISSKTMWTVLQGVDIGNNGNKPYDPDDFSRCYLLIKECNLIKADLQKIARELPYWKPYIDKWDDLTKMFETNQKNNWNNYKEVGMYELMQEIRKESDLIARTV